MLFRRKKKERAVYIAANPTETAQDGKDGAVTVQDKPKASWRYFVPVGLLAVGIWWTTSTPIFVGSLLLGTAVAYFYGSRMAPRDAKAVLVVDIEAKEVRALLVGRAMWSNLRKVNIPMWNFRTPSGVEVEIVKEFDPDGMTVTYPLLEEFADIRILADPKLFGDLIQEHYATRRENIILKNNMKTEALKEARDIVRPMAAMLDELMRPREAKE